MTRWLAAPNTTANTELLDTTMHSANTHNDASAINQTSRACVPYSPLAALMRREVRFDGATVRNRPKIASSPRSLSIGQRGVEDQPVRMRSMLARIWSRALARGMPDISSWS